MKYIKCVGSLCYSFDFYIKRIHGNDINTHFYLCAWRWNASLVYSTWPYQGYPYLCCCTVAYSMYESAYKLQRKHILPYLTLYFYYVTAFIIEDFFNCNRWVKGKSFSWLNVTRNWKLRRRESWVYIICMKEEHWLIGSIIILEGHLWKKMGKN